MPKKQKKDIPSADSSEMFGTKIDKPLARMKVSTTSKTITRLEVPKAVANADYLTSLATSAEETKETKRKKQLNSKKKKRSKEEVEAIDCIWRHLGDGSIDLKYATVGYSFDGRPILDHDVFVNLLINYGFTIDLILEFIDDFNEVSMEDDQFPIVMVNIHMQRIYDEVNHLDENEDSESKP